MTHRTVVSPLSLLLASMLCAASAAHGQVVFEPVRDLDGFPPGLGRDVALADIDGDGHLDLLEGHTTGGTVADLAVTLAFGDGTGAFAPSTPLPGVIPPIAVADVDEDGRPDIVHGAPAPGGSVFGWTRNLGGGALALPVPLVAADSVNHAPQQIELGDVDGDGRLDLAFRSMSVLIVRLQVLRGDGSGGFVETDARALALSGQMTLADVDGDGLDDLLYGRLFPDDLLQLARSLGDGSFDAPVAVAPAGTRLSVADDLWGDDREEVFLWTGLAETLVAGFHRLQGGALQLVQAFEDVPIPGSPIATSLDLADFDSDGRPDVALGWGGAVSVFAISRDGLTPIGDTFVGSLSSVAVGDVDEDGRPDLAIRPSSGVPGVIANHTYVDVLPFEDLGGAQPGGTTLPGQLYDGDLGTGHDLQLRLVNAPSGAAAWLVIGGERVDAPFAGGVLVPSPEVVKGPYLTDFLGRVSLLGSDVPPPSFDLFTQWWIVDDTAEAGFAASTAVRVSGIR